jgi:hypothetical protein
VPVLVVVIVAAAAFGVAMVLPIGGADMPVVISLLNAFTGTAVAMAGFVLNSVALIIAGALVGASGTILTKLMADAMNRSVVAVLVGGFGTGDTGPAAVGSADASVRSVTAEDAAIQLAYARKVIVVPGYGLAAAQAQHELSALAELLIERGVDVCYAIHPVAGRMPGHMNVLLAEANVPYPMLKEMDEVNDEFAVTDVALVVGANDVTNPAARRPGNPVSGMPILNVDAARSVIVIKRSMGHGYAGIDNELYTAPATGMLFADARSAPTELTTRYAAWSADRPRGAGGAGVRALPSRSPAGRLRGRAGPLPRFEDLRDVALRPLADGAQRNQQGTAELGEPVLDVWRLLAVVDAGEQAVLLHRAQRLGQHLRGDALDPRHQRGEPQRAVLQRVDHEHRPAGPDAVQHQPGRAGDGHDVVAHGDRCLRLR